MVCHETAHQWFGNLVTLEWWTHLWLNEGFASFMENLTTDTLYPEYHIWDQFVPKTLIEALKLDALSSSHPIEVSKLIIKKKFFKNIFLFFADKCLMVSGAGGPTL